MVGAIIQARMSSTRLPGKVLAEIAGKPLLSHIIQRLQASEEINRIVVAAPQNPEDDILEQFCTANGILCFRGPDQNVLSRFIQTAEAYGIDIVVRVCADSPLIDIPSLDNMIRLLKKEKADLVSIDPAKTSLLDGFEVTRLDFLKKLEAHASQPYHFEHVTYLGKENTGLGKVLYYEPPKELCQTDIRITVDTQKDLQFIREVFKWLYEEGKNIDVRRLDKLPFHIFRINQEILQKPANQKNLKIHVITDKMDNRLKELADMLESRLSVKVEFHATPPENTAGSNEIYFQTLS